MSINRSANKNPTVHRNAEMQGCRHDEERRTEVSAAGRSCEPPRGCDDDHGNARAPAGECLEVRPGDELKQASDDESSAARADAELMQAGGELTASMSRTLTI